MKVISKNWPILSSYFNNYKSDTHALELPNGDMGPFNCYVTQAGVGVCQKFPKKRYATVNFPPYRALQGVGGCQILSKKALRNSWMNPNPSP